MGAPRKLDATTEAKIVKRYVAGASLAEIRQEYEVSSGTIRAMVRRAGLTTRKVGRPARSVEA